MILPLTPPAVRTALHARTHVTRLFPLCARLSLPGRITWCLQPTGDLVPRFRRRRGPGPAPWHSARAGCACPCVRDARWAVSPTWWGWARWAVAAVV